jgi:hypothetical protein
MQRLNRLGTWGTAVQLDYVPGLGASAFVVFRRPAVGTGPAGFGDLIETGQAIQRFWLTATQLGLALQPTLATVAFAEYGETGKDFTTDQSLRGKAKALAAAFRRQLKVAPADVVFIARIGEPRPRLPCYRSVRLPLDALIERQPAGQKSASGGNPEPLLLPQ